MNKKLSEQDIERLVREAMPAVGQRRDYEMVEAMSDLTAGELDALLAEKATVVEMPKRSRRWGTLARLAVACAVLLLVIVGIDQLKLGKTTSNGYASLFKTYYKEYKASYAEDDANNTTFSAGKNTKNKYGKENTAKILQDASRMINEKHSRHQLHKGIRTLEWLLTLDYRSDLEHEIRWYLGLAYLKDNRVLKAREQFLLVVNMGSPHSAEAQKLLEKTK